MPRDAWMATVSEGHWSKHAWQPRGGSGRRISVCVHGSQTAIGRIGNVPTSEAYERRDGGYLNNRSNVIAVEARLSVSQARPFSLLTAPDGMKPLYPISRLQNPSALNLQCFEALGTFESTSP